MFYKTYGFGFLILLGLGLPSNLRAESQTAPNCQFANWSDLAAAVDQRPEEFAQIKDEKASLEASRSLAELSPSARLSGQFYKDFDKIENGELEASYLMVFENRTKKEARLNFVDESLRQIEAQKDLTRARFKVDLILGINRLGQIEEEQENLQETKETYRRLSAKLKNLPALSPEQELTLSIFRMAEDESLTRAATLEAERIPFQKFLMRVTRCKAPSLGFRLGLPHDLKSDSQNTESLSPQAISLESEKRVATAEQKSIVVGTMQDLEFGPIFRVNRDDSDTRVSAGLAVSLPINGERTSRIISEARAQNQARSSSVDLRLTTLANEKSRWLDQYNVAHQSLVERWDLSDLQKRHKAMESLFASGRINASLIIEGHRQIFESLKSRHALESLAVEAYWKYLSLTGSILEVTPK